MFNKIWKRIIIQQFIDVDAAVNLINEFKNDGPTFHIKTQQRLGWLLEQH
jgi:phosphoribosylaminoimidazolecarboxamide formyltransferase/IMP cyclohydrolase